MSKKFNVYLTATGLYTPPHQITNAELVKSFNQYVHKFNEDNAQAIESHTISKLEASSESFIKKASGIESRYVMDKAGILDPTRMRPHIPARDNEENSIQCEMAIAAAEDALGQVRLRPDDIDMIICACSNFQRAYPAISIEVQNALGINGLAFDLNVACSSAVFGIMNAVNAITSDSVQNVLVLNPEICSAHLNFRDRNSHFIFGDACSAMVLQAEPKTDENAFGIHDVICKTQFSNNIRNNFGFLAKLNPESLHFEDKLFIQNGKYVFKEVSVKVFELISQHLEANNLDIGDVKRFWMHQANMNMNELILKKLIGEVDKKRSPMILNEYANTSSAGSVIAFHKHNDLKPGEVGCLTAFGAGYSMGNVILEKI